VTILTGPLRLLTSCTHSRWREYPDRVTLSLRTLRLLPGEEHAERGTVALEALELGGQAYELEPGTEASLAVQRATSGFVLRLQLAVVARGPCMRCLDEAVVPVEIDAREYHDLEARGDEDLVSDYVTEDVVQLASWARDAVALALPDPVLCRPDCAGLCPVCGKNLNVEPHEHEDMAVDPRWAALEGLRDSS
jgi:uncharacterized protein